MVLAAGDRILIYTSKNLKQWTYASEFGQDQGSHGEYGNARIYLSFR